MSSQSPAAHFDILPPEIITLILQHLSFSELVLIFKKEPQFSQLVSTLDLINAFVHTFDQNNYKYTKEQPPWIISRVEKRRIPLPKEHIHQLVNCHKLLSTTRLEKSQMEKYMKKFHYHRIQLLASSWKYQLKSELKYLRQNVIEYYLIYFENYINWIMDYDIQASKRVLYYLLIVLPTEFCGSIFWTVKHPNYYAILEISNLERFCKVLPKYFYLFLKLVHPTNLVSFPSWTHSTRIYTLIENYSDDILKIPNGISLLYFISMFERVDPRKALSKRLSEVEVKNADLLMQKMEEFEFPLKHLWQVTQ